MIAIRGLFNALRYGRSAKDALYAEPVTKRNFQHLIPLVTEQAEHHDTTFRGQKEAFYNALFEDFPNVPQIFFVRTRNAGAPLAYVLYTTVFTNKGKAVYMEDICTRKSERGHKSPAGIGSFAFAHTIDIARNTGCERIIWVVAENNHTGRSFYDRKIGAAFLPETNYDLSPLLAPDNRPKLSAFVTAGPATRGDLEEIKMLARRIPCLLTLPGLHQGAPLAVLNAAAKSDTAMLFAARETETGRLIGYTLANANYSSFRTVMGLELENTIFRNTFNEPFWKEHIMQATLHAASNICAARGWTGHLCYLSDNRDPAQAAILERLGGQKLQMTDNPASRLLLMGIGPNKLKTHFAATLRQISIDTSFPKTATHPHPNHHTLLTGGTHP